MKQAAKGGCFLLGCFLPEGKLQLAVAIGNKSVSDSPCSDETWVGFDQEVRDVALGQIHHGVPRGFQALQGRESSGTSGTDGHHG